MTTEPNTPPKTTLKIGFEKIGDVEDNEDFDSFFTELMNELGETIIENNPFVIETDNIIFQK